MATIRTNLPMEKIEAFCRRWRITELALFGSVLHDDFHRDSDIDVLVSFADECRWSLFDLVGMKEELEEVFGRPVDLLTRRGVESSRNPWRRKAILSAAEVIYAA